MNRQPLIRETIRAYWMEAQKYKALLLIVVIFIVATTLLELWIPVFYKHIFDALSSVKPIDVRAREAQHFVILALIANGCVWVTFRTASFINSYLQPRIATDLREHLFSYLLNHSYGFFSDRFTGSLVQRVMQFSHAFERIFDRVVWSIIPLFIRVTGVTIILYLQNTAIATGILVWILIFLGVNIIFARQKLRWSIVIAEKYSKITGIIADAITNHTTIQLFNGHVQEMTRYSENGEDLRKDITQSWLTSTIADAVQALLFIAVEFAVFFFAIKFWQAGIVTIGLFVMIQAYIGQLTGRLWDFFRTIRDIYEAFADAREGTDILTAPHDIQDAKSVKPLVVRRGGIEYKNVSFGYNRTRSILKDISLTIQPGERIAFIGPSGAGKSTLVKLLFRFYDLSKGKILIDGASIHSVTQGSLRESLGFVPQEPILFHRTLLENIRYGRPDASDEEVYDAARKAYCSEFIDSLPDTYHSLVGERGIKLSGGERQRIAIARVILKNAPILVLDEATSSLDSHSESSIQKALREMMRGKTTIAIAHRLSTIRQMDRIIVIDEGKIIEEGSHEQLLKNKNGLYAKLWNMQSGGFLRDEEF